MAMQKTIDWSEEPTGRAATLKNQAATEFAFEAGGKTHVKVKVLKGFKTVSKPIGVDLEGDKDFTPDRVVINLLMKTPGGEAATSFSTPFELRVLYTAEDVRNAGGSGKLKLAYWYKNRWNILTAAEHKFQVENGDMLFAELSSWPADPPIAVGH